MRPANFPERKRRRQFRALIRIADKTAAGADNSVEIALLRERTRGQRHDVRTKKDRSGFGRIGRA